jgi:hypothetical protein
VKVKVTGIGKAVEEIGGPIYRDVFQPGAKEVGKGLKTIVRAFRAVLLPLEIVTWKYEEARKFLRGPVNRKLKTAPRDQINPNPKANVVVPALEAVALTEGDPDLEELFANLVASAMDKRHATRAFPAFVEIMKQLTADEAKILRAIGPGRPVPMIHLDRVFYNEQRQHIGGDTVQSNLSRFGFVAGCQYPKLIPSYINNLVRLGLLEVLATNTFFTALDEEYKEIETDPDVVDLKKQNERPPMVGTNFIRSGVRLSPLGHDFYAVCVQSYEQRAKSGRRKTPARHTVRADPSTPRHRRKK